MFELFKVMYFMIIIGKQFSFIEITWWPWWLWGTWDKNLNDQSDQLLRNNSTRYVKFLALPIYCNDCTSQLNVKSLGVQIQANVLNFPNFQTRKFSCWLSHASLVSKLHWEAENFFRAKNKHDWKLQSKSARRAFRCS